MYPITSRFGDTEHFRKSSHQGIDFAMEKSTPLKAIMDGEIQIIDYGNFKSGKTVVIKGIDGMTYIYGHLSEFKVKAGDVVRKGDLLGLSGNSGNVFGSNGGFHLDFSVKNERGQFIDPAPYIEFIQNMNNPKYMESLLSDTIQKASEFNMRDVMKQFTDALSDFDIFSGTMNLISFVLNIISPPLRFFI